jgi:hypothetical protein
VDITVYQKLHIVLIIMEMQFYIEKKDGNQILKSKNGKKENLRNNKRERSINMKEEPKVIFFIY